MPRATVESVEEYSVTDQMVTLECSVTVNDGDPSPEDTVTLPDRTVPITIQFISAAIFRFELDAAPAVTADRGSLELATDAVRESVDLQATERDGELFLKTGVLTVSVGLDDWSFEVETGEGQQLLAEQRADVTAKAEQRATPLGYDLELTNRWPYRRTGAGTSFVLQSDEHIYGLGETFTTFEKRGETVDCWVTQPNGAETKRAYKNVPFYLSSAGYGLLIDSDQRVRFDMGDSSAVSTSIDVADDQFAFVFFGGPDFTEILDRYTALTGRPGSVPRWSHGIWYSRMGYEDREVVETVLDRAESADLPVDVIHLDPPWLSELCSLEWDTEAFPDPDGFVESLHDRDVRLSLWEYPYLLTDTEAFETAASAGYLVEDGSGAPYILERLSWSSDRGAILDFTNEEAREWWANRHAPLIEQGADVFKCDFGEYLPCDAVLADGSTGRTARNRYPLLYAKTVWDAIETAGGDPLLWVRASWAGGQQFPVHWGGDPATSFEAMAASLRGGLSVGLSGHGFWSADVGGFKGTPSTELYIRWAQFALLANSHVRFHGTTPREPWHFDAPATEVIRQYSQERYRLLPYFSTLARIATERGLPVMRPLVLAFQDDHGARTCDDQVLLGPALMVAPVCSADGRRDVYLPPGEWIDYWSEERFDGGQTVQCAPALDELPAFLRAGTVHPRSRLEAADPDSTPEHLILRTALAHGCANGEVQAPKSGNLVDVSMELSDGTLRISAPLDVSLTVEVIAVETVPDTVVINGDDLSRVPEDPADGTWTYDTEGAQLTAIAPTDN